MSADIMCAPTILITLIREVTRIKPRRKRCAPLMSPATPTWSAAARTSRAQLYLAKLMLVSWFLAATATFKKRRVVSHDTATFNRRNIITNTITINRYDTILDTEVEELLQACVLKA